MYRIIIWISKTALEIKWLLLLLIKVKLPKLINFDIFFYSKFYNFIKF